MVSGRLGSLEMRAIDYDIDIERLGSTSGSDIVLMMTHVAPTCAMSRSTKQGAQPLRLL